MKLSICPHTHKVAHVLGAAFEGSFNPDCKDFETPIRARNPRDVLERRQAKLDLVSCFEQSGGCYPAQKRDLGYAHNPKYYCYTSARINYVFAQHAILVEGPSCKTYEAFLSGNSVRCLEKITAQVT